MPTFCDKSGQRVLVAMVFAYVMAGPLNNITINGSEVIRVFTCSGSLVYNLTKTRYELMFKPFQEALFNLKVIIGGRSLPALLRGFRRDPFGSVRAARET